MTIEKRFNPTTDIASEAVIEAVADAENAPLEDAQPPLYDRIDPDALDALISHNTNGVQIVFEWSGYRIRVDKIGEHGKITVADYFLHASDASQEHEGASQADVDSAIAEVEDADVSLFDWKDLF